MVFSPSSPALLHESERRPSGVRGTDWRKAIAAFVLCFVVVWLSLYGAYVSLPLIRPGATVISLAKIDLMAEKQMFGRNDAKRIMLFGNSKALSGFRPTEFDLRASHGTRSYNLALPGESLFLPILETALAAGNIPTHVLLTIAWDGKTDPPGISDVLRDDALIGNTLFPFRTLPRDAVLFVYNNRARIADGTRDSLAQRDLMISHRGWYFIRAQSHYPGDRLPDDYKLPTDRPDRPDVRKIPAKSLARQRLEQLAIRYGFEIILVPSFNRIGEVAPAPGPAGHPIIAELPRIRAMGPDYWTYPPSYFADPLHLNPTGASAYTGDLARLLKDHGVFE
jgi:hypothetical protein